MGKEAKVSKNVKYKFKENLLFFDQINIHIFWLHLARYRYKNI